MLEPTPPVYKKIIFFSNLDILNKITIIDWCLAYLLVLCLCFYNFPALYDLEVIVLFVLLLLFVLHLCQGCFLSLFSSFGGN